MARLNLTELNVQSFTTEEDPIVVQGSTYSLNYATHCDCSAGPNCTLECVEYSQATDVQACCG